MAHFIGLAFVQYYKHLMEILDTNAELKQMSKGIFKQMVWAAGGTAVGGVVGGPPGALIGGIIGTLYGYLTSDNYSSMVSVLKNLTDSEKQNLVNKVQELVGSPSLDALTSFVTSPVKRELLISCLRQFITNKAG